MLKTTNPQVHSRRAPVGRGIVLVALASAALVILGCGDSTTGGSGGDKFADRCDHDGPVFVEPGEGFTQGEIAAKLCIKADFAADAFLLGDCRVGILEDEEAVDYRATLNPSGPYVTSEDGTVGFTYDGSKDCNGVMRAALKELGRPAGESDTPTRAQAQAENPEEECQPVPCAGQE